MKLLYIHGLGGQNGGPLEDALRREASGGQHQLVAIRWGAGILAHEVRETFAEAAADLVSDPNPFRAAARGLLLLQRRSTHFWDSALAASTSACLKLVGVLRTLETAGESFSAVGFSLGARILLMSLCQVVEPPPNLVRAIFAGSATSADGFRRLAPAYKKNSRCVNVYSANDDVLNRLYPHIHGIDNAAGCRPVPVDGISNIEVDVGHLTYERLAARLVGLAAPVP